MTTIKTPLPDRYEEPTLKETLLDAIMAVSFQEHGLQKPRVMLYDVETIINRLIP